MICLAAQDAAPPVCMNATCNSQDCFSSCRLRQNCAMTLLLHCCSISRQQWGISSSGCCAKLYHRQGTSHRLAEKLTRHDITNEEANHRSSYHCQASAAHATHIVLQFAIHSSSQGYDHQIQSSWTATPQAKLARSHGATSQKQVMGSAQPMRTQVCKCPCPTRSFIRSDCTSRRPTKPDNAQKFWAA